MTDMFDMERMPSKSGDVQPPVYAESFRVRCPHCRKLYLVQYADVQEAKPRFECVQCHDRFWLSLPDMDLSNELVGLPLQVKEAPLHKIPTRPEPQTETCPKCFKSNPLHARECAHCGVLIAKAKAATLTFDEPIPPHSASLKIAWQKVVADYSDEESHREFIKLSERERNLPYAAAQYGQMKKLMPTDDLTQKRMQEIQALGNSLMPDRKGILATKPRMYPRLWQIPLLGAAILIVVGLTVPMFRNIVGLGAAFLFLGVAMQLQLRRKD